METGRSTEPIADGDPQARPAMWAGISGGVIGAVCCIGPAVGVAMGASAGSFLLGMGNYRFVTFFLGAVFAFAGIWLALRRRRDACPTERDFKALRSRWLDVALIAFGLTYAIGRVVVPRVIEAFA
jgi:hypothetical protein